MRVTVTRSYRSSLHAPPVGCPRDTAVVHNLVRCLQHKETHQITML